MVSQPVFYKSSLHRRKAAYGALVELGKVGPRRLRPHHGGQFLRWTCGDTDCEGLGRSRHCHNRTSSKRQLLLEFGADHVIATAEEDPPARVNEITEGKLAHIVFDPVGGDYVDVLAQATSFKGTIFFYGMLSGTPTPYPMSGIWNGVALSFYLLMQTKIPERFERMKRYIYDRLADGSFKPKVDCVFLFEEVVDATGT
jgi:NADPH2:quinone reductase